MKIILAPDKFKGCLPAAEVAAAMARGIRAVHSEVEIDQCPVADGGEGFVDALVAATGGHFHTSRVTGPWPDMKVDARWGILGDGRTAVVEMAAASGLALLREDERDPMRTTTYGTGELLVEAAKMGADHILLGIGGSATVDGGIGCAQACGLPVILDQIGPADRREPLIGEDLERIVLIKHARGSLLDRVRITVACDVSNPLCGPLGAARVYGPQKGATVEQVQWLDAMLGRLAQRCGKMAEAETAGAGAAGGLGFAMLAFFGAKLERGFDVIADAIDLRSRMQGAELCFTGEGRVDASSLHGKATAGVARLCREMKIPCIALGGSVAAIEPGEEDPFTARFSICDGPMTLAESQHRARELIADRSVQIFRLWMARSR